MVLFLGIKPLKYYIECNITVMLPSLYIYIYVHIYITYIIWITSYHKNCLNKHNGNTTKTE